MSSAYGNIDRPVSYDAAKLASLLPIETRTTATSNQPVTVHSLSTLLSDDRGESTLISYLQGLLNAEIESGNTYPQKSPLNLTEFKNYFLSGDVFVIVRGGKDQPMQFSADLEENILGTFYIKPNFPGRCSHICNGGFITSARHRNQGIGKVMALAFLAIAPLLGYKASMFNLVFANNLASIRLWRSLNFQEIGRVPNAGSLRKNQLDDEEEFVDAIMFHYSFT